MYDQVKQNKRRSALLIFCFIALVVVVAFAFDYAFQFGWFGVAFAFLFAGGASFVSYWNSDKVALRLSHAEPADRATYARLYNLVEGLTIASGLPMPALYIVNDPAPNAFATGRDPKHASIAVTTGLLEKMNRIELEGVLAHELSHVKNYDIRVSSIAVCLVGVVAALSDIGIRMFIFGGSRRNNNNGGGDGNAIVMLLALVVIILAPLMAMLMQLAVSRKRESLADVSAVEMTRYPPGLISALEKLRDDQTSVKTQSRATAHLWIEEPMDQYEGDDKKKSKWSHLFDTHPPIEDRIAALREM